ncbi:MAG: PepSY-associated TM helix domain-containing protein [Polyangiaceae bacterium]
MRQIFLLLHRYVGLTLAAFLVVTGLTGAVISWDHELDEWLNPHLIHVPERSASSEVKREGDSPPKTPLDYVADVEARHPEVQITYVPLLPEHGHTVNYWAEPRFNSKTGRLHDVDFNQIFVDPATGEELGTRKWGAVWPLTKETFVSFLYKLHFSLHIPAMWGTDHWGVWLLGVVALLWTLDCFVGFYLTLPARRKAQRTANSPEREEPAPPAQQSFWARWKASWLVRTKGGAYKLNFDLHRAGGLWTWLLAFVLAFTGFSMNLYAEVFEPIMTAVSDVTPSIWTSRKERPPAEWTAPKLSFSDILSRAPAEAKKQGIDAPAGHLFYSPGLNIYEVEYYRRGDDHGSGGVGHPEIYFDGTDGRVLGNRKPWTGTAADIFVQAQFPVHSGRILGIPGRILISLMGLVVAALSVTGVYIWYKSDWLACEPIGPGASAL